MANKTFTTYRPTEDETFTMEDYEGVSHTFKLNPSLPGKVILDFMFVSGTDDSSRLAKAIQSVLNSAIAEDDVERWNAFSEEPKNGVTIGVLSELVGHITSVLSGNPPAREQ